MQLENLIFDLAILLNLVTILTSFRVESYFSQPESYPSVMSTRHNSYSDQVIRGHGQPSNVQPHQNYFWIPTNPGIHREQFYGHHQVLTPRSSEHFFAATGEQFTGGNNFGSIENYDNKNGGSSYSSQKNDYESVESHKTTKTIQESKKDFYYGSNPIPQGNFQDKFDPISTEITKSNSTSDKVERNVIPSRPKRVRPSTGKPQGGQIVFPDRLNKRNFTPSKFECAKRSSSTFCEQIGDDYPTEHINRVLRKEGAKFREFFGQEKDFIPDTNITERINFADEDYLCPYKQEIIYPKAAKNKEDKWLFIVNHDKYLQGVKVEICLNPNKQCSLTEGFPLGYTTYCKQKYIERKMVALGEEGKPRSDYFILPSCCSCVVKYSTPAMRMSSARIASSAATTREKIGP